MTTTILNFDPEAYPFHQIIAGYVGRDDLTNLRAEYGETADRSGNSLYKNMEASPLFRRMYAALNGKAGQSFYNLYRRFLADVIRPRFDGPIYYQTKPSHRILFADTPGQSRFHRDSDYGHDPAEINFLVPQTPAAGNNTMWIESEVGKEDYGPLDMELGQFARFHGAVLSHGAMVNDTGRSRVSFDFRVVPADRAPERYRTHQETDALGNPVMDNAQKFSYLA